MITYICVLAVACFLVSPADGQAESQSFSAILSDQLTDAAKRFFAANKRPGASGFDTIDEDEFWTIFDLFRRQYGDDASTARFVSALMDFEYFESKNSSFSDVTQFIVTGEYQRARQAFAAHVKLLVLHLMDADEMIRNIAESKQLIETAFRSTYDIVGNDRFSSFLNLKLGSSLSFVMDTTGSMSGEIGAAKERVKEIIKRTRGTTSAPLDYVLMPYNDPGYGPITKTSDPAKFTAAVENLTASGGGDFAELAMIGILKAARSSGFRSIVYVFTDASAKDYWLRDHVIALCLTKKIAVFVFLTQNIGKSHRQVYEDVADKTGGSVLFFAKEHITGATAIMEATTVQGLVMLVSVSTSNSSVLHVDVDSSITSLLVQFTGTFGYIAHRGPSASAMVELTTVPSAKLFRLNGVRPGRYSFHFNEGMVNDYGALIRGTSGLGFHARLSQQRPGSDEYVASNQLRSGQNTRAEMTMYGDISETNITLFQLVSHNGEVLFESQLHRVEETRYKTTKDFSLPDKPMFARLVGTHGGMPFVRIDPCSITPTSASSTLQSIQDMTVQVRERIQITTVLHNRGERDNFTIFVSDDRDFVTLDESSPNGLEISLGRNETRTITLTVFVNGTVAGVLSKVLVTATAKTANYFVFTTFIVSVIDTVVRCPSPKSPIGGKLKCSSNVRSIGSVCFLECGDQYVREGNHVIECKSDGTWGPEVLGKCRYLGSRTCRMAGDPHYKTFDGRRYDFQGSCLYTFIKTHEDTALVPVTIQTENGRFYGNRRVAWFKRAFVTIYNTTIILKKGRIVLINGIRMTLPHQLYNGNVKIRRDGKDVLITTNFKMQIRLNRGHDFRVSLPASYRNNVYGLCGNYDGNRDNDIAIGNLTFKRPTQFGNALEIVGGTKPWCRKGAPEDDESGCNEAQRALYAIKCAAMKTSCFAGCADEDALTRLFDDCVFDMCAFGGGKKILEDHISDFATNCMDTGLEVCNWRKKFRFPLPTCGRNQHYKFRGNRCPNTCIDLNASKRCIRKPNVEGCFCNNGFVLDGNECIRQSECGCAINGTYYKNRFTFIQKGCNSKCTCLRGELSCSPMSCEEGTECRISRSGQYSCELSRVNRCYATGDPHYLTLDGKRFDFMGVCRYTMLSTGGAFFENMKRHINITAQNEHRGERTTVSYVRSVSIGLINGVEVQIGPGTKIQTQGSFQVSNNGSQYTADDDLITIERRRRRVRATTKYGIIVQFDGTNLYIDVPSLYMSKVSGLCGNYNELKDDDLDGLSIPNFALAHKQLDGCAGDDVIPPLPVCSPEDKVKWQGWDFCGKMKNETGPFVYCQPFVDIETIFENCVFDACITGGEAIIAAFHALAEECQDMVPCDWEVEAGIAPDCPVNSKFVCASGCQDTCQDPFASIKCESSEEYPQCVCFPGYILNNGECIEESTCGCVLENGTYVNQNYTEMSPDCQYSVKCIGPGSIELTKSPCSGDSKCTEIEEGKYECVPKELAYALVYGGVHFKTFDGRFFDFQGKCTYLLAGHEPISPSDARLRVLIVNKETAGGNFKINEVIVEWTDKSGKQYILRANQNRTVTLNGIRYAIGSRIGPVTINLKRGNLAIDFFSILHVHYNGKDWVRVDAAPELRGKTYGMGGNYNGDKHDDFRFENMMHSPVEWGNRWMEEKYSSKRCSRMTPSIRSWCPLRARFERTCDCGALSDRNGPFAACHGRMDPEPFMRACVSDVCQHDGSPLAMIAVMKAYQIACYGKGIALHLQDFIGLAVEGACPKNSHFSNCTARCQPSCSVREAAYGSDLCEEGCVCNSGYIMSNGRCIPEDYCGCTTNDGVYIEHGVCHMNENCTRQCTCVYGEWNCEDMSCNNVEQSCEVRDGVRDCYWADPCCSDNGGCSDICSGNSRKEPVCSCHSGRILTVDNKTCVEISPVFFQDGSGTDACGVTFNIWKEEFLTWQNVYVPKWQKEVEEYEKYVASGIVSADMNVCQLSWTRWYDIDDPSGCGDEESLALLRIQYPEICEKPATSQVRLADGRELRGVVANLTITETGVVCKNAEQKRGVTCPDLAIRFLCQVPVDVKKCN